MNFTLQVCQDCGAVQYPRRSVCGQCLSAALEDETVRDSGVVLSWTRGHVSVLPQFKDKLPAILARVQLDAGPIVLVMAHRPVAIGARLQISLDETTGLLTANAV